MTALSTSALQKIQRDFIAIQKMDQTDLPFSVDVTSKLDHWQVKYFKFNESKQIWKDFQNYQRNTKRDYIEFELSFPPDYPDKPPALRLIQPRLTTFNSYGGANCNNGLSSFHWNANYDVAFILNQYFNFVFNDQDPNIDFSNTSPYAFNEYQKGIKTVVNSHKKYGYMHEATD
jgi:ubiquitin-conjugating enzyme E2 Q